MDGHELTSPRTGDNLGQNRVYLVQNLAIVFTTGEILSMCTLFTRAF